MKTQIASLASGLAFLIAIPVTAPAQDKSDKPDKSVVDASAAVKNTAREIDDKEAREVLKTFKQQMKDNQSNLKGRIDACAALGRVQHKTLIKPLVSAAQAEKSMTVRQEAIKALGSQSMTRARPELLNLMKKYDLGMEPGTTATLIRTIGNNFYTDKDWNTFRRIFDKALTDPKAVDAQKAILEVVGNNKEVDAVQFLLQHIDPPEPANVDDPSNPPASYWEARWKNWAKWKGEVKESLFKITGQRFANRKEAEQWLRKNRSKLGRGGKQKQRRR